MPQNFPPEPREVYGKGEIALATAPVFLRNNLRLYCNVPLADLENSELYTVKGLSSDEPLFPDELPFPDLKPDDFSDEDEWFDWDEDAPFVGMDEQDWPPNATIPYVVCMKAPEGLGAILNIDLTQEEYPEYTTYDLDIPLVNIPSEDMENGRVDYITRILTELCQKSTLNAKRFPLRPIGLDLQKELLHAKLLDQKPGDFALTPTEFGKQAQLSLSYLPSGGRVARMPCCSDRVCADLQKILNWGTDICPSRKQYSFSDRMERLDNGLYSDDFHAISTVRRVQELPLAVYMERFPGDLDELEQFLPGPPQTYQQAAAEIHKLIQSPDTDAHKLGKMLMKTLALPLLSLSRKGD